MRARSLTALTILAIVYGGASTAACKRSNKNGTPVAQIQTQTPPQAVNQSTTVTGCLRAGDASDTYVLTTSETQNGATPATYLLVSTNGANFRDNIGHEVQVSGVLSTEQAVSTVTPASPPANKPAGTSGKPAVETQTQLDMRRLEVSSLNSMSDKCQTK
jgi:hypothetical protein